MFIHKMKRNKNIVRIAISGILMIYIFFSCGDKNKDYVDLSFDKETVPSVQDDSVSMLISDSGVVKYHMKAKDWLMFDRASNPHWYFPRGIYIEQFDTAFQKQASIKSDTAWNYTDKKLWHLKGNVFMNNIHGDTFETEELFWDEKGQKLYSDKYIEIIQPDKLVQRGIGFESNTQMTQYKIFRPFDSYYYVAEEENNSQVEPNDSIDN